LAAHHRVVVLDFRSHGASTPCEGLWTIADAVDDVQAVIAALHLANPWLVGHSIGGMVATRYAATQGVCRGVRLKPRRHRNASWHNSGKDHAAF
jgi:pimeloyl-ACP methyl ester carboxylesterase